MFSFSISGGKQVLLVSWFTDKDNQHFIHFQLFRKDSREFDLFYPVEYEEKPKVVRSGSSVSVIF
jgi:hypothetical protein